MLHKYEIHRDMGRSELTIREYAIIHKREKTESLSVPGKEHFTFLCEESYDGREITNAIAKGLDMLISSLRTGNMYPIEIKALKIAESVMALYDVPENGSTELFFDDQDLLNV